MDKKEKLIIKICCVLAAFVLWLYIFNTEDTIKEKKIDVPVTFINEESINQQNLVVTPGQDFKITLTLAGKVSDIYSQNIKKENFSVVVDLGAYAVKKGTLNLPVTVKQWPNNVNIVNTNDLYIKIDFDTLVQKNVSVKLNVDGKPKDGYASLASTINPSQVTVKGAPQYVNAVDSVVAKADIKDMDKSMDAVVPLQAVDSSGNVVKEVTLQKTMAQINIPIKKIKYVDVKVKTVGNISADKILNGYDIEPSRVGIAGNDEDISAINEINTQPIDLQKINDSNISAKLIIPDKITLVSGNATVNIKVNYNKILQKSFDVPITMKNIPDTLNATLAANTVNVTLSGVDNVISALKVESFSCTLDLIGKTEGDVALPVTVTLPTGVTMVTQNPPNIKITLKKK